MATAVLSVPSAGTTSPFVRVTSGAVAGSGPRVEGLRDRCSRGKRDMHPLSRSPRPRRSPSRGKETAAPMVGGEKLCGAARSGRNGNWQSSQLHQVTVTSWRDANLGSLSDSVGARL